MQEGAAGEGPTGSSRESLEEEGDASPLCSVVKETHIIADPLPDHSESRSIHSNSAQDVFRGFWSARSACPCYPGQIQIIT